MATGRADIPYENLGQQGVQVYGMPPGVPFHNPLLYNQQQLQQILANLEKIAFLKLSHVRTYLYSTAEYVQILHVLKECNASLASKANIYI